LKLAMDSGYHGALNVGTGTSYSFNQVAKILAKKMDIDIEPEHIENPINNYVAHTLADTTKAEVALGFQSRYTLDEGIEELIKYYVSEGN